MLVGVVGGRRSSVIYFCGAVYAHHPEVNTELICLIPSPVLRYIFPVFTIGFVLLYV